jgi:hypothetical protein
MGKRPAENESFDGNMGSIPREDSAFYAKRRIASHGNGTRTNSSKSSESAKTSVYVLGPPHYQGASLGESLSDSDKLGSRGGRTDGAGGEGELRGVD